MTLFYRWISAANIFFRACVEQLSLFFSYFDFEKDR